MSHIKKFAFILFISFLIVNISFNPAVHGTENKDMHVHFIDVGQGDSILIETPSQKSILIDGGPPESGKKVVTYLKDQGIAKLDLLIATHPDIDHIGGLLHVMREFPVKKIIDSGKLHTTKTYAKYIEHIWKYKIPVEIAKVDDTIPIDPELSIDILNSYSRAKTNNDSSIVLKVNYKEVSFLFMGDLEKKQEKKLANMEGLDADIIKVAHHGSKTSSSFEFLQRVKPQIAILTYSKQNEFGHPVDRVIHNLNKINALIYSTAVFGDLVIRTNGDGYFILPEKSPIDSLFEQTS